MAELGYRGIKYPDRAESLKDTVFSGYRVFLDHWDSLAKQLRFLYEGLALRNESRGLLLHGSQGSGKTLFATKLTTDFEAASDSAAPYDKSNLWHRITGGDKASPLLAERARERTTIRHIEDDKDWVNTTVAWRKSNPDRHCIVVVDNAERAYFLQSLLGLSDVDYLRFGNTDEAAKKAAERFVALARGELRRCLFVIFTNDDAFALRFDEGVNAQHKDLLVLASLPPPSHYDKEVVIRTNINRLNPISYWYCLDKAGAEAKVGVLKAFKGEETYPGAFAAVDRAIRTAELSRVGRPANKCLLTLLVMHPGTRAPDDVHQLGTVYEKRSWDLGWLRITTFQDGWAEACVAKPLSAMLLESEWNLRVITVGAPFVASLLGGGAESERAQKLLGLLQEFHGTGTHDKTLDEYRDALRVAIGSMVDVEALSDPFWAKGQERALEYEGILRALFPAYNTGAPGFLRCRPDLVLSDYTPCSVLGAVAETAEAVTSAIRRSARAFEFTTLKDPSKDGVVNYLKTKVENYVEVVRDQ